MAFYEHITILPNNQAKCILCEDILEDSNHLLEAHLHDKKHRELFMKNLMTTNNIIINASGMFCYICNISIDIPELISHVCSIGHQSKVTNIKELVRLDGDLIELPEKITDNSSALCTICDNYIEFTHEMLSDHIRCAKHKRAKAMVLQPLHGIFSVEGKDAYLWCKVCQIFFDNYIELIFQHVEETDHAKKIGKILRLIDNQNIDIDNYLQNLKEDKAICTKCGIEVPCNVDNLQRHINGKKHKS